MRSLLALFIASIYVQYMLQDTKVIIWQLILIGIVLFLLLFLFVGYKRRLASFFILLNILLLPSFKGDLYVLLLLFAYVAIPSGEYLSFDFIKSKNMSWKMDKYWFYTFFISICFINFYEAIVSLTTEFIEDGFIVNDFFSDDKLVSVFFNSYGEGYLESILLVVMIFKISSLFLSFFTGGRFCAWIILFVVSIMFIGSLVEFFSILLYYLLLDLLIGL